MTMHPFAAADAPPTDFVAFLAQRGGLSPEAAEHRLECWFGEYHAASGEPASNACVAQAAEALVPA